MKRFGSGLLQIVLGADSFLPRQTTVGVLSDNRPEWVICDQACFAYSLISVPLLASSPEVLLQILTNCGAPVVVSGGHMCQQNYCFLHSTPLHSTILTYCSPF